MYLFYDGHLVDQVLAVAQLIQDEEYVADIHYDAALQCTVEVDVAT